LAIDPRNTFGVQYAEGIGVVGHEVPPSPSGCGGPGSVPLSGGPQHTPEPLADAEMSCTAADKTDLFGTEAQTAVKDRSTWWTVKP
jgi:hypothetical protein